MPDVFPQYRKYTHTNTFFKIVSEREFEELSFVGSQLFHLTIKADQYPEYMRIQDMLNCEGGAWEEISAETYENKKASH
jgi:hypothetical protein